MLNKLLPSPQLFQANEMDSRVYLPTQKLGASQPWDGQLPIYTKQQKLFISSYQTTSMAEINLGKGITFDSGRFLSAVVLRHHSTISKSEAAKHNSHVSLKS